MCQCHAPRGAFSVQSHIVSRNGHLQTACHLKPRGRWTRLYRPACHFGAHFADKSAGIGPHFSRNAGNPQVKTQNPKVTVHVVAKGTPHPAVPPLQGLNVGWDATQGFLPPIGGQSPWAIPCRPVGAPSQDRVMPIAAFGRNQTPNSKSQPTNKSQRGNLKRQTTCRKERPEIFQSIG